jgi:hypothetical protein
VQTWVIRQRQRPDNKGVSISFGEKSPKAYILVCGAQYVLVLVNTFGKLGKATERKKIIFTGIIKNNSSPEKIIKSRT